MDSAEHNDAKETAATYQAEAALREVESGNRSKARADVNTAMKLAPNRDVRKIGALALARAGDTAGAEKLAAELDKTFPLGHAGSEILAPQYPGGGRIAAQRPEPGHRGTEGSQRD